MLYIIYGKDREKGRAQFRALREDFNKKCGEEHVVLEGEAGDDFFNTAASSQGLFGGTTLFVFDCMFDKKGEQEILQAHAGDLVSSPNIFLIFEPLLEKSIAEEVKEGGAEMFECVLKSADTRPDFNIFSLGDALGQRNKKEFWVLYQEALANDIPPEEICGTLFWAVKNIALMKEGRMGDLGLNPFVARKTREFAKNYTQEEIRNISHSLVVIYHEAHRGGEPMDVALERFILAL